MVEEKALEMAVVDEAEEAEVIMVVSFNKIS